MIPLLLTTVYLFIMSLMVSSDLLETRILYSHRDLYLAALEKKEKTAKHELATLQENRSPIVESSVDPEPKLEEPRVSPIQKLPNLDYDLDRPPNNARINFYDLLFYEKGDLYEHMATLLRQLYQKIIPQGTEYQLLEALLEKKEEAQDFVFPDELATLVFEDQKIQDIFHQILAGGEDHPSLLLFITFDKQTTRVSKKINFLFASREILLVFFPETLVESLLQSRTALWAAIKDQHTDLPEEDRLTRRKISQKAQALFKEELEKSKTDPQLSDFFEFTLGKKGSILLIEDPLTHQIERKKILKRIDHR